MDSVSYFFNFFTILPKVLSVPDHENERPSTDEDLLREF